MPVSGPDPSDDPRSKRRLAHKWVDVPDVPYSGPVPVSLPRERTVSTPAGYEQVPVLAETRRWWRTVRAMPHCVLWSPSDWSYALTTALVADLAFRGGASASAELARRERVLGTTLDARRGLRIRYVDPGAGNDNIPRPDNVLDLERRNRINRG